MSGYRRTLDTSSDVFVGGVHGFRGAAPEPGPLRTPSITTVEEVLSPIAAQGSSNKNSSTEYSATPLEFSSSAE